MCGYEMTHMLLVAVRVNDRPLFTGWKEIDAHSVFFTNYACYCMAYQWQYLSPSFGLWVSTTVIVQVLTSFPMQWQCSVATKACGL